jgi:Tfp pilus assembly protein PilN
MPQQINLCTPILLTQKRYFSALTMVQALVLIALVGGGIIAYWVWTLKQATAGFRQTVAATTTEMTTLKAAIQSRKAVAMPVAPALVQELQNRRLEDARREKVLFELRRGLFKPGWGQSARLQLVAQTIPPEVWVTQVQADERQIDVSGFTVEPAALNEWVRKLAISPLLQGQSLATIKVERVVAEGAGGAVGLSRSGSVAGGAQKLVWSFNLVSALTTPVVPVAASAGDVPGGKP